MLILYIYMYIYIVREKGGGERVCLKMFNTLMGALLWYNLR